MGEINETTISPPVIINWVYEAYNFLVQMIAHILQVTIFQQDPSIATQYANIIAWLIPLTAVYVILVFASSLKKILGYVIAAGWIFLLIMLILAKVG